MGLMHMNSGEGPQSYARNCSYQGGIVEIAKQKIEQKIAENMEVKQIILSTSKRPILTVADFGCATGLNSFPVIKSIIESLVKKMKKPTLENEIPEIVVFFNDVLSNDFNTLFSSLPHERNYKTVAIPGDFYLRLLPESSLIFAYCSWSLHWMTEVPREVADPNSLAYNQGSIIWSPKDKEHVHGAYLNRYVKDMGSFLEARSKELVGGGMMALLIAGVPNVKEWDTLTQYTQICDVDLMGSGLYDLAKKGRITEAQVDSFNVPYYFPTPEEMKDILHQKSHLYTIEQMEIVDNPGKLTLSTPSARAGFFRAVHEKILTDHFGNEIMDELFELYEKKLEASPVFGNPINDKSIVILLILKRK